MGTMEENYDLSGSDSGNGTYTFPRKPRLFSGCVSNRCGAISACFLILLIFVTQVCFIAFVVYGGEYSYGLYKSEGEPLINRTEKTVDDVDSLVNSVIPIVNNITYYLTKGEEISKKLNDLYKVVVPLIPFFGEFRNQFENMTLVFIPKVTQFIDRVEACEAKYGVCASHTS